MKKWKGIVAIALAALTLLALAAPALAASLIGTARAKEIALETAGVTVSEARGMRTRLTRDDGRRIYDVEFRANGVEYEFEIDAETGAVREYDRDGARRTGSGTGTAKPGIDTDAAKPGSSTDKPSTGTNTNIGTSDAITLEKAKAIALEHAEVSASEVRFTKARQDRDNGRQVYEIEFRKGRTEYEYEIDASTGRIRDYDRDYDD